MGVLLEVAVRYERDVPGALEGGADRLVLATPEGAPWSPAAVSAVCREAVDVPVFVEVADPAEVPRLLELGATGVAFGALDADLGVDVEACAPLAGVPWVFTAVDATLEPRRAWARLLTLPGLVHVRSAGSPRGMAEGYDELLATAESDPAIAALLLPGGGLLAEHVPWLVRTGVRAFHVGPQVRPGGSLKAYVDPALTRSWRLLLDDALDRV